MNTIARTLQSGGFAAFTCQSTGLALIFIVQVGLARVLGADSYGMFAYVTAWIGVLGIIARCGLDTAVLRDAGIFASRGDWPVFRGLIAVANKWTLLSGCAIAVCCVISVSVFTSIEHAELRAAFWIGAAIIPVAALSAVRQSALLALNRPWAALAPEYIVRPFVLGVIVLVLFATIEEVSAPLAMYSNLAAVILTTLLGQVLLMRGLPEGPLFRLNDSQKQSLKTSAWTLLWLNGASQCLYQIDTILIGALVSPAAAGKYYAAKQIALIASLGLIALQIVAAPRIAALNASSDRKSLQRVLSSLARRGFAFAAVYALLLLIGGRQVLGLFGADFGDAYPIMMLLILGQLIGAAGGAAGQLAAMAGLQAAAGAVYVAATLLSLLAGALFIPTYGAIGASVIVVLTTLVCTVALNAFLWRRTGVIAALVATR